MKRVLILFSMSLILFASCQNPVSTTSAVKTALPRWIVNPGAIDTSNPVNLYQSGTFVTQNFDVYARVYLIDEGKKRLIPSMDVYVRLFTVSARQTKLVHLNDISVIPSGPDISLDATLYTISGSGSSNVYFRTGTTTRLVANQAAFDSWGLESQYINNGAVNQALHNTYQRQNDLVSYRDTMLAQQNGTSTVYWVDNGMKRVVPDYNMFVRVFRSNPYLCKGNDVVVADQYYLPTGVVLDSNTALYLASDNISVYLFDPAANPAKPYRFIATWDGFQNNQFNQANIWK